MAAVGKVMNGARALVYAIKDGRPTLVGIFNGVNYNLTYDAQASFILGRFAAADIDYTAAEVINFSASGWRVIGAGPHTAPGVPLLQQLLTYDYMSFTVIDRGTKQAIATIKKVRPLGYSTGQQSRQQSEVQLNFMGIYLEDESGAAQPLEDGTAADLP